MARKGKRGERSELNAAIGVPAHVRLPTPAEQAQIRKARVDDHLKAARSAIALAGATGFRAVVSRDRIDADVAQGIAQSGKQRAFEKEGERLQAYHDRVNLRERAEKDDRLKCRPKSSSGNGAGRKFVPWSDKC